MTLIVALKYVGGAVLASDTRVMIGDDIKRDKARKLELIGDRVGVASAGLTGACDDIVMKVDELCGSSSAPSFENVSGCLSDAALDWHKRNHEKIGEDEDEEAILIHTCII